MKQKLMFSLSSYMSKSANKYVTSLHNTEWIFWLIPVHQHPFCKLCRQLSKIFTMCTHYHLCNNKGLGPILTSQNPCVLLRFPLFPLRLSRNAQ